MGGMSRFQKSFDVLRFITWVGYPNEYQGVTKTRTIPFINRHLTLLKTIKSLLAQLNFPHGVGIRTKKNKGTAGQESFPKATTGLPAHFAHHEDPSRVPSRANVRGDVNVGSLPLEAMGELRRTGARGR